jgi:hypothetical protein
MQTDGTPNVILEAYNLDGSQVEMVQVEPDGMPTAGIINMETTEEHEIHELNAGHALLAADILAALEEASAASK